MCTISSLVGGCIAPQIEKSLMPEKQLAKPFPENYRIFPENISFRTSDGLLIDGWWIQGSNEAVIIVSHAFGANRSGWKGQSKKGEKQSIDWLPSVKILVDAGYSILMFDHRACGASEGRITAFGKQESLDIEAAIKWVRTNKHHADGSAFSNLGLLGFSSGANACLLTAEKLANNNDIHLAIVAVNVYWYDRMIGNSTRYFTNVPIMMLPLIKRTTRNVLGFNPSEEINPLNTVRNIKSPLMFVNAQNDEIAQISDIRKIYNASGRPKEIEILPHEKRFDAYHFVENHPEKALRFFSKYLLHEEVEPLFPHENSAILLIEFQKTWTERSFFHRLIKKELQANNVIENTHLLLREARAKGVKIIHVPLVLDKTKRETYYKTPFPARVLKQFTAGTWKAEFTEGVYINGDEIVEGRYGFDATKGSNLLNKLQKFGIKNVIICGFTTDRCVKETIESLEENGYNCIMVKNGTATRKHKIQAKYESEFRSLSVKEILDEME